MKYIIGGIAGILLGIGIMLGINLLPKPFSDQEILNFNDTYVPTLKIVSNKVKMIANKVEDKVITLHYDNDSVKKETILSYHQMLQNYGYRNIKNDFANNDVGEFIQVISTKENELIYVTCKKNEENVTIEYEVKNGQIEVMTEEKFLVYNDDIKYYDFKIDDKNVKVPSLENVVDLELQDDKVYENWFRDLKYKYVDNTTSEQKESYLNRYTNVLLENGFYQGKDKREYHNGMVSITIRNDYSFNINISKYYN